MKRIIRKLKNTAGFTLAETLLTVVILLLVSGVVATGMPAAVNAYRNAIDAANAQVLLSTTVNALRNELSTARDVQVSGTTITYTGADTGSRSTIDLSSSPFTIQEYVGQSTSYEFLDGDTLQAPPASSHPLVPEAMAKTTKNGSLMTVELGSSGGVALSNDVITITGLTVKRDGMVLVRMPAGTDLTIRVFTV